jgi:hypothetical protein
MQVGTVLSTHHANLAAVSLAAIIVYYRCAQACCHRHCSRAASARRFDGTMGGNDQSEGGEEGAQLLTGAMTLSPHGDVGLMQRNTTSVLVDFAKATAVQLDGQVDRFIFAKDNLRGVAMMKDRSVQAIDIANGKRLWSVTPAYKSSVGALRARLSDDNTNLVVVDNDRLLLIDVVRGDVRGSITLGETPTALVVVPGKNRVLAAGGTRWVNHLPQTTIYEVDLESSAVRKTVAANCASSIQMLPDASRAFMSPTFCEEGRDSKPKEQWTNPDPVSIIDLSESGPNYLKNLPGFGPVAMTKAGDKLVAYLDMKRIDPAMFDDKSQIPGPKSDQFHLMVIDPKSLAFTLSPIGPALPRFAMSPDGKSVLVDSSVTIVRGDVDFKLAVGPGGVTAGVSVFGGNVETPLGQFDLSARKYQAFVGPKAALDRFVQLPDASAVYTLKLSEDGLGGDLFKLDRSAATSVSLGKNLRDIGMLRDGKTLVMRIRKPAAYVYNASAKSVQYFRAESYCLSQDGVTCGVSIDWKDKESFETNTGCDSIAQVEAGQCRCKDTHDCY